MAGSARVASPDSTTRVRAARSARTTSPTARGAAGGEPIGVRTRRIREPQEVECGAGTPYARDEVEHLVVVAQHRRGRGRDDRWRQQGAIGRERDDGTGRRSRRVVVGGGRLRQCLHCAPAPPQYKRVEQEHEAQRKA